MTAAFGLASCVDCTWSTCTYATDAACGQCRTPHVHVCHRPNNPNGAEAKTKHPWRIEDGIVTGGLIKRVSPAMIHTYFDYITIEYP